MRAIQEMPGLAKIINTTTFTTTTNMYSPPSHQQQPFRESEIKLDSDSAASATSSLNSLHPPHNTTTSLVPDSSQCIPGYVPGMHRPMAMASLVVPLGSLTWMIIPPPHVQHPPHPSVQLVLLLHAVRS